jgi:Ni,Fe-hydrogenase III large subunit
MSSSNAWVVSADELTILDSHVWREGLESALRWGARPLIMYGRAADAGSTAVIVTAVVEDRGSRRTVLRTVLDPHVGYHALTPEFAAMHCFERELHEQHAVRIAGHPWLKPVRFEHTGAAGRDAYGFYEIKGKEVHEVAVGPIHAGVIEPGSFRFMCLGERVHHLEIHLGYQHRGVEALLLARDPRQLAPLVETIAGDTSIGHTWAYCAAIEALAGVEVGLEIEASRGVMLELERIAMHLGGLGGMAGDIGFLQGATTYGRLRTTAINTSMRLCGSRFGRGAIRPAGSGTRLEGRPTGLGDIAEAPFTLGELRRNIALLSEDVAIINECFLAAGTVRHRLQGVGTVTGELAEQVGLVGMAARASGIARDLRTAAGGIYREHPIEPCVETSGDCWARARLRMEEINRSLVWIAAATESHPRWKPTRSTIGPLAPRKLVIATIEGWRGEVVHVLETGSEGLLVHYKVQDPSFRNWMGVALAVRDNEISDFPICNKSFDLSYCGNDL